MNQPPPLPLIDGCLFIDNSMLELLTTCPRALEYNKLWKRISSADKPSLNFGSAVHLALEYRYKTYANKAPDQYFYEETAKLLTSFFNDHPAPVEDWRTLNWCIELMTRYNNRYEQEDFNLLTDDKGNLLVEMPFALPLFTYRRPWAATREMGIVPEEITVIYTGRIDLPISLSDQVFVMDHKTASMLGPSFFERMRMSAQQKGYCWAFEQLTKQKVAGYVVNAIRTKEPPNYITAGKEFTRNGKTTSPETWWRETFQRERYILRPGELEEWRTNTIALVEEFFWHYQRGFFPQKTMWCTSYGRCPYYDVCTLPQEDRGVMLASGLFTENKWNPLKEPTQTKQ